MKIPVTLNYIKKYSICIISFSLLFFFILLSNYSLINVTDVKIKDTGGNVSKASIPIIRPSKGKEEYIITGKFYSLKLYQNIIRIIPNDGIVYIKINNKKVSFDNIDVRSLSDSKAGFYIDISPYTHKGENNIEIKIYDYGYTHGLALYNSSNNRIYMALNFFIIILSALTFYYLLMHLKFDKITALIMICGLTVMIIYLINTYYRQRTYDYWGHMEYIEYVSQNYSLPKPDSGWENFQPPVYYITGAIVYKLAKMADLYETKALQVLSLIYFQIFLIFGILIFKRINFYSERKNLFYLSVALLVFWPSGIINSARITNDVMSYMFYTAGLYFLIKWHDEERDNMLYSAAICTFLGTITKFNAFFLGAIIGVLLLYKLIKEKNKKKYIKNIIIISIIILSGILLIFLRNFNHIKPNNEWISVNVVKLDSWLSVGNKGVNYLYFDTENFIKEPFTSSGDDSKGRQFFWNYLFKTGLFGEFRFSSTFHHNLGTIMSFLFLIILIFFLTGLFLFEKSQVNLWLILLLNIFFLILSVMFYRIKYPFACNGDFRFIYPVLITFIPVYIYTLNLCQKKIFLFYTGYITSCLFILLTILFFTSLWK